VTKVTFQLNGNRSGPPKYAAALEDFLGLNFDDVVRQVEKGQAKPIRLRLEARVNQVITAELKQMQRALVGNYGLIGRDISSSPLRIESGSGPQIWGKQVKQQSYQFVKWEPYSPAYRGYKEKKFPSNWRKWFTATGSLRSELESPALLGVGGLRDTVEVKITPARVLGKRKIKELGSALSLSQRGVRGADGDPVVLRSRTRRLRLLDVKLKIFTNLTPRDLPYLASGDINDTNSGGAILQKLNLSAEARRKLGPPARFAGSSREVLPERYRPVFEPLLTFWLANRIPSAVAKALYNQSGRSA
jgi:hypothetical protein